METLALTARIRTLTCHPVGPVVSTPWDVFAEGTIGCGNAGQGALALLENNGRIYGVAKLFAIPHPEKPSEAQLLHGAIEGPELAVYYRGEGCLLLGCAHALNCPHTLRR